MRKAKTEKKARRATNGGCTMSTDEERACWRCGGCCMEVGPLFWNAAYLLSKCEDSAFLSDFADGFPDVYSKANPNGQCMMLRIKGGLATCLLEKHFGRELKPKACREYEPDHRCPRSKEAVGPSALAF